MTDLPKREPTPDDLREQLRAALAIREKAAEKFDEVIREIPRGLAQPGGSQRIVDASREYTAAQDVVIKILAELNRQLGVTGKSGVEKEGSS